MCLKGHEDFQIVYITPDLTRKQQSIDKDLREHIKNAGMKMLWMMSWLQQEGIMF